MSQVSIQNLQPGEIISDRYEVLRPIGEGGMGWVYLGKQLGLDRKVAIKTLHPTKQQTASRNARFRREASIARSLTHPNTVRIYDFGETSSNLLYLVMEYLEGVSLEELLRARGKLTIQKVTRIAQQVLKSLVEAHAYGIIHRDLKPSNLMLCRQIGQPYLIKVLDFGIARIVAEESSFVTASGALLGTLQYMAPEQAAGEEVDARSDLYSLGLTLLELATGHKPFQESSPIKAAMRHLTNEPLPVPDWFKATQLGPVIARACQKSPKNRYQSAQEMYFELTGESLEDSYSHLAVCDQAEVPETLADCSGPDDSIPGLANTHVVDLPETAHDNVWPADEPEDGIWSTEENVMAGNSAADDVSLDLLLPRVRWWLVIGGALATLAIVLFVALGDFGPEIQESPDPVGEANEGVANLVEPQEQATNDPIQPDPSPISETSLAVVAASTGVTSAVAIAGAEAETATVLLEVDTSEELADDDLNVQIDLDEEDQPSSITDERLVVDTPPEDTVSAEGEDLATDATQPEQFVESPGVDGFEESPAIPAEADTTPERVTPIVW